MKRLKRITITILALLAALMGCAKHDHPLDGRWDVKRGKTETQRLQRLGETAPSGESEIEWGLLGTATFSIEDHRALTVALNDGKRLRVPLRIELLEENLWSIQAQFAQQFYQMKAARVGEELRLLDAGHLYILEPTER